MSTYLAYPDWITGLSTVSLSGGSWVASADISITNLLGTSLQKKIRSADLSLTSTKFVVDLGASPDYLVLAIGRHNLSPSATITIKTNTSNSFGSPAYTSSTLKAWPNYPTGSLPVGHPAAATLVVQTDVATWDNSGFFHVFPAVRTDRYIEISISDQTNSAGYIELARLFLGRGWWPLQIEFGCQFGHTSDTVRQTTLGGVDVFDARPVRRFSAVTEKGLTPDQRHVWASEFQRIAGSSHQAYFVFDDSDASFTRTQRSFLCTLEDLPAIEYPYVNVSQVGWKLREVL